MSQETFNLNDNLVQIDNLITGLNYLFEEVETRKNEYFEKLDVSSIVQEKMETREFRRSLMNYISDTYGSNLYREVAFMVMEKIDEDIAQFVNSRVDERLRELGVIPPAQ